MFIRILQFLALSVVTTIFTGGIVLSIWPELASNTNETGQSVPRATSPLPAKPLLAKPIIVDSYESAAQHPIHLWTLMTAKTGHIDSVKQPAASSSMIELSGWAGHSALGMRFAHIVFSVCDKVVGSTAIQYDRPDVAKSVHSNLLRSGWSAHLHSNHLPTCTDTMLRAWGLAPTGKILWPLNDSATFQIPKQTSATVAGSRPNVRPHATPLHPSRINTPKLRNFTIKPNRANLRRCASTSCKIVGKIKGGAHKGYIVEMQKKWALLQFNAGAGWMARRLFVVSSMK